MSYGKRAVVWTVVSLLCASCGKSGGDEQATHGVTSKEELAAAIAQLVCGSRATCCEDQGQSLDETRCRDDYEALLLARGWREAELAGASFDEVQANDCLGAIEARQVCGELDDTGNRLEACDYVLRGDVAPGEPCESRFECAVGRGQVASCGDDMVCLVFTLRQAERGREGDACRTSCADDECLVNGKPTPSQPGYEHAEVGCYRSDGLYCGDDELCRPLASLGEPCRLDQACVDDAHCAGPTIDAFVCREKLEDGADCSANPPACRSGYCDEETWLCGQAPALRAEECSDSL